jgi:hypothetical protein
MPDLSRRQLLALLLAAPAAARSLAEAEPQTAEPQEWISLFDGKSLDGWKADQNPDSFKVVEGAVVAHGGRSHLHYNGPVQGGDFKNFEISAEVMTQPGSKSGIWFHSAAEPSGTAASGLAVFIESGPAPRWLDMPTQRTGSLYPYRNVYKQLVPDNEWFTLNILVRGKQVQVRLNNMLVVDYIESNPPVQPNQYFDGALGHGTFAIFANGEPSETRFKNLRVRPLPDTLTTPAADLPVVDDLYREVIRLGSENFPLVDYHVHLKGGLTIDQALANSRRLGIFYGVAINCGLGFPVHSDASVREYLASMKGQPCYVALQAEGREWMTLASPESIAQFDYCFTDAMTFTDDNGRRMRLWIDEEVGLIPDPEAFMEMLVRRIQGVMREPIDIYANATFLPRQLQPQYDTLWTPERMDKVIAAAIQNDVAIEINARYKIPSATFIKRAKAAGAKFSFGTNNPAAELGRLEYPLQMVRACGLIWSDIFVPKPDGQKPIQVKNYKPA